jgi:gliding motility associated protien GldN
LTDEGRQQLNSLGLTDKFKDLDAEQLTKDQADKLVSLGVSNEYIVKNELSSQDVTQYKIKGLWYFDKRQGELKYRMLGICPVTPDVYTMDTENPDYIELFWVFFPDARETLYRSTAFNEKNSSMPVTFDQILNSRKFNSMIYREENVFGDRDIKNYMIDNAQNQLLESERIKDKIRSFEQDMWNY